MIAIRSQLGRACDAERAPRQLPREPPQRRTLHEQVVLVVDVEDGGDPAALDPLEHALRPASARARVDEPPPTIGGRVGAQHAQEQPRVDREERVLGVDEPERLPTPRAGGETTPECASAAAAVTRLYGRRKLQARRVAERLWPADRPGRSERVEHHVADTKRDLPHRRAGGSPSASRPIASRPSPDAPLLAL